MRRSKFKMKLKSVGVRILHVLMTLLLLSASAIADGIEHKKLSGVYTVWGETPFNNENAMHELHDSHYYVYLNGRSAHDLYMTMKIKPIKLECHGEGSLTKRIKNMSCSKLPKGKGYECAYAINVSSQKIENADACFNYQSIGVDNN